MSLRSFGSLVSVLALTSFLPACEGASNGAGGVVDGKFFLPTGEPDNTSAPSLEVDAKGGIHAVYPAYAGGSAYYAYCPSDCAGPDDVSVVKLETDATVANAMLALDSEGQPRVLLSTFDAVYYAVPGADFSAASSWSVAKILQHDNDKEVTGEAFALDPNGRPRFLMHTYVAYLGIGQKTPATHYVVCDADCLDPASWASNQISDQIWRSSQLRFDRDGGAHVATVALVVEDDNSTTRMGAYFECDSDCANGDSWIGTGLLKAYENDVEAVSIKPAISMALTSEGHPRVALLADADFQKNLVYFECDSDCNTADASWTGTILSDLPEIGAGLDLALDSKGHPRIAYTLDYNIGILHCDEGSCTPADAKWDLTKVEAGGEMDPDEIFLWENCDVAAWFLHSPSIALDADGTPRVGYQARDISGGWDNPDPANTPDCVAGTDMTWSRLAVMTSL